MIFCWHRPGGKVGSTVTCRHCRVAIEICPCVDEFERKVNDHCPLCRGSMWLAVVRSARAQFAQLLEAAP